MYCEGKRETFSKPGEGVCVFVFAFLLVCNEKIRKGQEASGRKATFGVIEKMGRKRRG